MCVWDVLFAVCVVCVLCPLNIDLFVHLFDYSALNSSHASNHALKYMYSYPHVPHSHTLVQVLYTVRTYSSIPVHTYTITITIIHQHSIYMPVLACRREKSCQRQRVITGTSTPIYHTVKM